MDNWFRYYRQPKKLKFEYKDLQGKIHTSWMDYEEWKHMRDFYSIIGNYRKYSLTPNECIQPNIKENE